MSDDEIPAQAHYRGVPIDDQQPIERVKAIVEPAIDYVFELSDMNELLTYSRTVYRPPEARRLATAKLEAAHELAITEHRKVPDIDLRLIRACTAGLGSQKWRSSTHYCSLLDVPPSPGARGADRREAPLYD